MPGTGDIQASNAQRFRTALALVALTHIPLTQSIASYVLDLRKQFPINDPNDDELTTQNLWRERALSLEEDNSNLKRKMECEHAELCALRAKVSTTPPSLPRHGTPPSSMPKKKKRKAGPTVGSNAPPLQGHAAKVDLRAVIAGLGPGERLPALDESLHVLSSYYELLALTTQTAPSRNLLSGGTPVISSEVLISSTAGLIQSLGNLLSTSLPPSKSPERALEILKVIDTILHSALSTLSSLLTPSKPSLKRDKQRLILIEISSQLDRFISKLTSNFLAPLLTSFIFQSLVFISSRFQSIAPTQKKRISIIPLDVETQSNLPDAIDLRPDLLALLRRLLSTLRNSESELFACKANDVQQFVALEAASEIAKLWPSTREALDSSPPNNRRQKPSRTDRVHHLARKDALWYLCAVLHDVLPQPTPTTATAPLYSHVFHSTRSSTLLQDRIGTVLSALLADWARYTQAQGTGNVLSLQRGSQPDEIEKGMVMSVVEKAWLAGFGGL